MEKGTQYKLEKPFHRKGSPQKQAGKMWQEETATAWKPQASHSLFTNREDFHTEKKNRQITELSTDV